MNSLLFHVYSLLYNKAMINLFNPAGYIMASPIRLKNVSHERRKDSNLIKPVAPHLNSME
jgi:hypothetical protein